MPRHALAGAFQMLLGVYIFVDDDFDDPVYAVPALEDLDDELSVAICQVIDEAMEGDRSTSGVVTHGSALIGYRMSTRTGISHVAVVEDGVARSELVAYLQELATTYADEVDAPRQPERAGVADVVDIVEPPWEE
jgi:hypothetical protein